MQTIENSHFTELIQHNSKLFAVFSPSGHAIASAALSHLQIWDTNLKKVSYRFECENLIDFIKWSPDSELICAGTLKECIQVWSLNIPYWRCKITGCLPFINIHWAPDSCHLLVISEFYIKITIFSLVSSMIAEIDNPKAVENGIVFSPCEKYLVVAQRINFEDYLKVYDCDTWEAIKAFVVETKDLTSISFSPNSLVIAVLDSALENKVLFYSIDGRLLKKYVCGLILISWKKMINFVAIGNSCGEVKILNKLDFEVIASYQHPDSIESNNIIIYKVLADSDMKNSSGDSTFFELDAVVKNRPVTLLPPSLDNEKGKIKSILKSGVQTLDFSTDGRYIASINGNMPKIVFIYDVEKSKLCNVIIRGSNIKSICWHPEKPYLAICSTSNVLDLWTPEGCVRYISPLYDDFPVCHVAWNSSGNCILLNSRDHFSILVLS